MSKQKTDNPITTRIQYNPSPDAKFRLSKALSMLLNEDDILNYYSKKHRDLSLSRRTTKITRKALLRELPGMNLSSRRES